ncbi:MAG: HNH endonuclease [Bacteroidetes bacterium]|nr:HNH endonuclease [Bacteroidota bacterium]
MAAGSIESVPYYNEHWDDTRDDEALYVDILFGSLLHPERDGVLPRSVLSSTEFVGVQWDAQSSGILIPPQVAEQLEHRWNSFLTDIGQARVVLAEEIVSPESYYEGASRKIYVNRYERDANARKACIAHHGAECIACGFEFGKVYGERGAGFIHVHHLVPLSAIKKGYQVNPQSDLVPLCPNCHAMVHRYPETLTIDQLRDLLS